MPATMMAEASSSVRSTMLTARGMIISLVCVWWCVGGVAVVAAVVLCVRHWHTEAEQDLYIRGGGCGGKACLPTRRSEGEVIVRGFNDCTRERSWIWRIQ